MPEYSGVAAVLPAPPQQQDAGTSILNLAEKFLAVKAAKQQQALSQVQTMVDMAGKGFPVDDKMFAKFVKQARLPIDLNPDSLAAQVKVAKGQVAAPGQQQPDKSKPQGGENLGVPPKLITDPAERQKSWVNQIADRAQKIMNLNANTEEMKAKNLNTIESLKATAMAGGDAGEVAAGKLIQLNQWDKGFNLDYAKWSAMDDKQKSKVLNVAAGMESDADKAARGTRIGDSLISSGKVSDPGDAYQMGKILADGGTIPPALQSKMKPFTFAELGEQAKMVGSLIELGVPPSKVGQVMQAASRGGLENALPTGLKPIALQSLQLEQTRTQIELARYNRETEIAHRAALAEQRKDISEQAKADLNTFKNLVELKKAGMDIDKDLLKGASVKAAKALDMDATEVNDLFHFLTGGTHIEFSAALTPGGKSTVDKFSGKGNKTPPPSDFQKMIDIVSGKFSKGKKQEDDFKGNI